MGFQTTYEELKLTTNDSLEELEENGFQTTYEELKRISCFTFFNLNPASRFQTTYEELKHGLCR